MSFRRSATALAVATATALTFVAPANAAIVEGHTHTGTGAVTLEAVGSYDSGIFDASAAEIVSFHPESESILTVNAESGQIDVIDASDVTNLSLSTSIQVPGHVINSVSVRADGLAVAAAEPADDKTAVGKAVFFDLNNLDAGVLHEVTVGSLPDMVTFNEDGSYALVANEGEPSADYTVDPEGSVSVISVPAEIANITEATGQIAGFEAWNNHTPEELFEDNYIRVFGFQGAAETNSQNFEPEYITVDGDTAYAALQENNAIAVIDIPTATVTDIFGLGVIDRGVVPFDPSDRDPEEDASEFNLRTYEGVKAFPLPDAIDSYNVGGTTYIVTANEGDARAWQEDHEDGYIEELRFKDIGDEEETDIVLGENIPAEWQDDAELGRMNITTAHVGEDRVLDEIYTYGGRGFSIYNASTGEVVSTSGSDFEEFTHAAHPEFFNSNHSESNFEGRSDDKGPEPEAVTVAELDGKTYAFIANERVGGIFVYDITNPAAPVYSSYLNNRDFAISMEDDINDDGSNAEELLAQAGDLGPEGLHFVSAEDSPNDEPLLIVGNEVSGTTTVFQVNVADDGSDNGDDGSDNGSDNGDDTSGSSFEFGITGVVIGAVLSILASIIATIGLNVGALNNFSS